MQVRRVLSTNPSLKISGKYPSNRNNFFKDLDLYDINKLSKKYIKKVSLYKKVLGKGKRIIKRILKK